MPPLASWGGPWPLGPPLKSATGTTWVSRYQKGKTNLDFTEARDSEWQWHQLGHMQVCTSLRQITTPAPHRSVFTGRMPFLPPNQQHQSTEGKPLLVFNTYEIIVSLKTSGRHAAAANNKPQPNKNPNPNNFNHNPQFLLLEQCAVRTGNEHTANDASCLRMSVICYVLNADSGR